MTSARRSGHLLRSTALIDLVVCCEVAVNRDTIDKTALSYWFPKLEAAGVPVPRTLFVDMPKAAQEAIWAGFDGKAPADGGVAIRAFCDEIRAAATQLGLPCFLRTDHTSGKHDWRNTCFLASADDVPEHVFAIAEYSELSSMAGELPWSRWCVRELLPTIPLGTCPGYGDMPVCREFRFFVDDGVTRCRHPYWPREALEDGGATISAAEYDRLCEPPADCDLKHLAEIAGRAVGGSWSIDVLETRRGWMITDMAEAEKSFHWPGCPHGAR